MIRPRKPVWCVPVAVALGLIVTGACRPVLSPTIAATTPVSQASPALTLYPSPTPTITPTATPAPTVTPIPPSPTPVPAARAVVIGRRTHYLLERETPLFSGPGNVDFDRVALLEAGQAVYPLGTYVDFMQVEAAVEGDVVTGFVHQYALGLLPAPLPALDPELLRWAPLYLPDCSPGKYDAAADTVTFDNRGDGYYDTQSNAIPLAAPLRIRVAKMDVRGASYGSIKLLGVPTRHTLWWEGITRLDLAYIDGRYHLGIRDGTTDRFVSDLALPLDADQPLQVVFDQVEGKSFSVYDRAGRELRHVDLAQLRGVNMPGGLFPEGVVYVGTSTNPRSSLAVTGLSVGTLPDGVWVDQPAIAVGLAELAERHNLTIGTEFVLRQMIDTRYCRAMKRDFNVAVLSEFSWGDLWRGPGEYDFETLDRAVDYAIRNGWRVRGSHLVWGALEVDIIPDWLLNGSFTRDEYIQILEQHVKTMVGRYKGRVHEWSVANEYPSRTFWDGDFWNAKIGPEYVEMSFRWAKEADPESVLILNDANNESPRDRDTTQNLDKLYETARELKGKGVPVDAVGLQMHLLWKWHSPIAPTRQDVLQTINKFGDLGVRVQITELDVSLTRLTGTQAEKWAYQAQLYRDMLEACLESGVCDSFTTWGISDSTSWITCLDPWCQTKEPDADPLMFDKDFNPKPAYWAVRDALLSH